MATGATQGKGQRGQVLQSDISPTKLSTWLDL